MTVTTVYSSTADGRVQNTHATYATARSGGGTFGVTTAANGGDLGQVYSGVDYSCRETFFEFDTSAIGSDTVTDVEFATTYSLNLTTTDFIGECRIKDWGGTLNSADYVAGADLGSYTLVATIDTSTDLLGSGSGTYSPWTSDAAFLTNINGSGTTRVFCSSDRMRNNNTPSTSEYFTMRMADNSGTTDDPRLIVTHTAPTTVFGTMTASFGTTITAVGTRTVFGTASATWGFEATGFVPVSGVLDLNPFLLTLRERSYVLAEARLRPQTE